MTSGGPPYGGPCAVPPLERRAERPRLAAGAVCARITLRSPAVPRVSAPSHRGSGNGLAADVNVIWQRVGRAAPTAGAGTAAPGRDAPDDDPGVSVHLLPPCQGECSRSARCGIGCTWSRFAAERCSQRQAAAL
jgi:hypothetical protein